MNNLLPPGPWEVRGNKIVTGNGQTIAVVFFPRYATEIARKIAEVPDLLRLIEELGQQLESYRLGVEREDESEDIE